jgi:hypothetical protein
LFLYLVVVALTPDDHAGAVALGIPLSAIGILVAREVRGTFSRLLVLAVASGLVVGGVLMVEGAAIWAAVGWLCFGTALALVVPVGMAVKQLSGDITRARPSRWGGVGIAATLTLLAVLCGAAFYGSMQRTTGYFAQKYGDKVSVSIEDGSCFLITSPDSARVECEGSWDVDGETTYGTVHSVTAPPEVAYVLAGDDDAYSADSGERSKFYMLGLIPWWLMLPFPIVAAACLVLIRRRRRT